MSCFFIFPKFEFDFIPCNMDVLLDRIHSSEQKWLKPLYSHLNELFSKTHLPSHDAQHHLRVWLYCRGLIIELHGAGVNTSLDTIDKAIIACFFHDSGLTIDVGERHGYLGRKICEEYFTAHPDLRPANLDEVFEAIEFHDDKSKREVAVVTPYTMKTIPRLVSAADDLDALGFIGVFRYIEIYLKRGVPDREIPKKVTTNLRNRFSNFLNVYSGLHRFAERQKQRYKETFDFFSELDALFAQSKAIPDSQMTVFEIIKNKVVRDRQGINQAIEETLQTNTKGYPLCFFSKLRNELEVTSALLL